MKANVSIPQWCDCCPAPQQRLAPTLLFQSHNGAIAAVGRTQVGVDDFSFNPTMVRLLRAKAQQLPKALLRFNPTMVRLLRQKAMEERVANVEVSIPQWCDCCKSRLRNGLSAPHCFNPTMVRLLQISFEEWLERPALFQSHNGAIAATSTLSRNPQASDVSIPQWCDCCGNTGWFTMVGVTSFNPTMVRLLPYSWVIGLGNIYCFNPTMVRLLRDLKT